MKMEIKKHPTKKWEVSFLTVENKAGKKYKVTRRIPHLSVAETKTFESKEKALNQFNEWLQ